MNLRFITVGKCRHNVRIWGTENPHGMVQHERASPEINVFCAMSTRKVCGPLFFREDTATETSYMEMLQTWLFPRLQEDEPENFITQQDGAPPHFRLDVRRWLNDVLPHPWTGRGAHEDLMFCPWPARSPDVTPCDYFLWGYVKDKAFVPPQPASIPGLKNRITAAVEIITPDLLIRVWQELDYRLDVCHATKGAYIEHL